MYYRITFLLMIFSFAVFTVGCHILLTEQEWSENYALMEGVQSTVPQMIDGNHNTVGETQLASTSLIRGQNSGSEVIITLPEKKIIRRIVLHSDNIKKFNIYADKGGSALSKTDWQLVKEFKSVKSFPLVIPFLYSYPTDKIRIVVLDTSDDASLYRKEKTSFYAGTTQMERNFFGGGRGMFRRSYSGRISEIEIYGYKSAEETAAAKSDTQRENELDAVLE